MASAKAGLFVTFEGGDGVGKSTQIQLLLDCLDAAGVNALLAREPGGTGIGEKIRTILLDPAHSEMADMTELLLYEAARAQLAHEVIRPALADGRVVICDRWTDSTLVYQGAAKGLSGIVENANAWATDGLEPELTILLDLEVSLALSRTAEKGALDRIEALGEVWHERVRAAYLSLASRFPNRICVVDASGTQEAVHARVRDAFAKVCGAFSEGGAL